MQTRRSSRQRQAIDRFQPEGRVRNDQRPVPYGRHRRKREKEELQAPGFLSG